MLNITASPHAVTPEIPGTQQAAPSAYVLLSTYTDDPERGGNTYWYRVVAALRATYHVEVLTIAGLGLDHGRVTATRLAAAVWERMAAAPAPLLQDTCFWRGASRLNRRLRQEMGVRVISFGQEDYIWRRRSWLDRMRRRFAFARYLRTCDGHIVVSRSMRDHYRSLGVGAVPVAVAYPGASCIGIEAARTPRASDGHIQIVSAGVYTEAKGYDLLIDGLGLLKRHHPALFDRVQADCYGNRDLDRRFVARMEERIRALDLGAHVRLHASLPQAQLWTTFAQADLFVFVANGEGFALVIPEALAQGCVPILGREGSAQEALGSCPSGLLVGRRPREVMEALRLRIDQQTSLPALSVASISQARRVVRPWSEAATEVVTHFTAMIAAAGSRRSGAAVSAPA